MKFLDTHFNEYIQSCNKNNLHPQLLKLYNSFPDNIENFENLLFYGPQGVGKYTQMLLSIVKYSPSNLKYDKKICINFNKSNYYYKISDIHVEIDMSLLGCNSKLLWNDIYTQLIDVASAKPNNTLIIVCKNFQNIHSELLDNFYSYMQTIKYINIKFKFIIITNSLCFIPKTILDKCKIINVQRPTKKSYSKVVNSNNIQNINVENLVNIKHIQINQKTASIKNHKEICDNLIEKIEKTENFNYLQLRDVLYDILIYDMDIYDCIWYILQKFIESHKISVEETYDILKNVYIFFKYYNNNYRPIYHLESIIFYLIEIVKNKK